MKGMQETTNVPSVFDYLDVTQFLNAYFQWRKSEHKTFTYTQWALDLDIGSPTILRFILQRRRSITKKAAQAFCDNLRLSKAEADYFHNLVSYTQAKTVTEQRLFGAALLKAQRSQYKQVEVDTQVVAKSTLGPVILTLLTFKDINKTVQNISHLLKVDVETVRQVLQDFESHGLVVRNSEGHYSYGHSNFKLADAPGSSDLKRYYEYWIERSKQSLLNEDPKSRKFRAIKCALNEEEFNEIQGRLGEFALTLLSRFHSDHLEGRKLYMLNTSLFPLTQAGMVEASNQQADLTMTEASS